jgi:hypothetical protein
MSICSTAPQNEGVGIAQSHTNEPLAYTVADACRVSTISKSKLYLLIAQNQLETRKIGARTIILADSLRRLLEEGC